MHQHTKSLVAVRPRYVVWGVGLFVVAVAEVLALPRTPLAGLFGVAGLVAGVSALHLELRRREPRRPATTAGVGYPPAPLPVHPVGGASAGVRADPDTGFPAPPRFDERGSSAHARPWLLPARTSEPGVTADEARLGRLDVRAASVIGPGHRCEEPAAPRQDAYRLGRDRAGRYLVTAVADGLSSAAHSDLGATVAVRRAVASVVGELDAGAAPADLVAERLFSLVAADLRSVAARHRVSADDLSCVLVVAVLDAAAPPGPATGWLAWIGDVSVWRRDASAWTVVAGGEKDRHGDIRATEVTACLPGEPGAARAARLPMRPGDSYAFVSDGVGDLWWARPQANAYFAARWSAPPPVPSFLNDVCFDARGEQDDRTAVVVWAAP